MIITITRIIKSYYQYIYDVALHLTKSYLRINRPVAHPSLNKVIGSLLFLRSTFFLSA